MAKVKVNHNGACGEYTYEADKEFDVKAEDLGELQAALGDDLIVLEKDTKKEEPAKETEAKDAKPANDKMVKNDGKDQKVVTK